MMKLRIEKGLAPLSLAVLVLAGCGGGGGGSSSGGTAPATKTAAQLSAEASAAMAAATTISTQMDWKGAGLSATSAGDIRVASSTSMGDVSLIVSTVDYKDPTTGQIDTTPYRGTVLYDSRSDDPNKLASTIDAAQQNASFTLKNVNLRSAESVYVEVFSATKGLAYQQVVATSALRGVPFVINLP
jgi:hypothetical protein